MIACHFFAAATSLHTRSPPLALHLRFLEKSPRTVCVHEQIQWTPIKYFSNKIVCYLIQERRRSASQTCKANMSLQREPELVVVIEKAGLGVSHEALEHVRPLPAVLVESSIGMDPLSYLPHLSKLQRFWKKPAAFAHCRYRVQGHYHSGQCLAQEQQCVCYVR